MKIFTTGQIAAIDRYTIEHEPVTDLELMERASRKMYEYLSIVFLCKQKLLFFAGTGNNGGDALAMARMFADADYPCTVYHLVTDKPLSPSCAANLERLRKEQRAVIHPVSDENGFPLLDPEVPIIEGLFGAGLTRPLNGLPAALVRHINQSGAPVFSIDMPAGLMGEDNDGNNPENIIRAKMTLTLQFPKISLLFPGNEEYAGQVKVIDIGLHPDALALTETPFRLTEKGEVGALFPGRKRCSHKGIYGHALLIAGSYGMAGAAVLASQACLRSGAGVVTTHLPTCGYSILQATSPEILCSIDPHPRHFSEVPPLEKFTAIGVGPGLGTHPETRRAFLKLLNEAKAPLLLDADALNLLAAEKSLLSKIPAGSVLTPHPGEFRRLSGEAGATPLPGDEKEKKHPASGQVIRSGSWHRLEKQRQLSQDLGVVIVLKGDHTSITLPNGICVFNPTGNPGMATAGSGDVLTGIITGLLAQGLPSSQAAIAGVFLHGLAGDRAARKISQPALVASDIISFLGKAFREIINFRQSENGYI